MPLGLENPPTRHQRSLSLEPRVRGRWLGSGDSSSSSSVLFLLKEVVLAEGEVVGPLDEVSEAAAVASVADQAARVAGEAVAGEHHLGEAAGEVEAARLARDTPRPLEDMPAIHPQ